MLVTELASSFARGMCDTAAPTEYRPDECAYIQNGRVSLAGHAVRRRKGLQRTHAAELNSGAQAYGGIFYKTAADVPHLVVFIGDTALESPDDGLTWNVIATALRTDYWDLCIMRVGSANYMIAANGGANVYYWDGATWGTLAGVPTGVKFVKVFNDRLYVAGHSGSLVQACAAGDPNTWLAASGGLTIQATTHDGDPDVTGLFQIGSMLIVFKRQSMGYIDGFGADTLAVHTGASGISRSVGCIAFRTIRPCGDGGLSFVSERGVEFYQQGTAGPQLVTDRIGGFMATVNWPEIVAIPGLPCAEWWALRNEYRVAVPVGGGQNTHIVVFRPPTTGRPASVWLEVFGAQVGGTLFVDADGYLDESPLADRSLAALSVGYLDVAPTTGLYVTVDASGYLDLATIDYAPAVMFVADLVEVTNWPITAGYDGFVRKAETSDTDDALTDGSGGADIAMRMRSRPMLFGKVTRKKRARSQRISAYAEESTATVSVRTIADGRQTDAQDAVFMPAAGETEPGTERKRVAGRGYSLQSELYTTDDVTVQAIEMSAEPLLGGL